MTQGVTSGSLVEAVGQPGNGRAARSTPTNNASRAWRRFRANRLAVPALLVAIILAALALSAPLLSRYVTHAGPDDQNLLNNFGPPSRANWLGTDEYGRDVLTRLIYGGRVSLGIMLLATGVATVVGTLVGALAAFYGGWVDQVLMRFVDVMLSIPTFYLLLLVSGVISMGPVQLAILIALVGWLGLARLIRSEVLTLRERPFVESARVAGAPGYRIIGRHIMPNVMHLVIVYVTASAPGYLLAEAALSYLGLGVHPPTASWGNMLTGATQYLYKSPGLIFDPGIALTLTVLSVSIIGNALRDALDPRADY